MSDAHAVGAAALYGVPIAAWIALGVALVCALSAVLVAWRSNLNSRRNLDVQTARAWQFAAKQLKHDAEQRTQQHAQDTEERTKRLAQAAAQREEARRLSLRRAVYLRAATALTGLQSLLGRAVNLDADPVALLDELSRHQGVVAKVHVVATEATLDAVMTYMNEVVPAFVELLGRRAPLSARHGEIAEETAELNKVAAERERFVAMMQQFSLEGMRDSPRWQAVDAQCRLAGERFDVQRARLRKLRAEQLEEQAETAKRVANLLAQSGRLLPAAMLAVRAEIETPLDRRRYEQLWSVQFSKVDFNMKQTLDAQRTAAR